MNNLLIPEEENISSLIYIIDRWSLFNPPGFGPFDKDPDDDIPFHGFEEDPEE